MTETLTMLPPPRARRRRPSCRGRAAAPGAAETPATRCPPSCWRCPRSSSSSVDLALGLGLAILIGGFLVVWVAVMVARGFARVERLRLRAMLGRAAPTPAYLSRPTGAASGARRSAAATPSRGSTSSGRGRPGDRDPRLRGHPVPGGRRPRRPDLLVLAALDPRRRRRHGLASCSASATGARGDRAQPRCSAPSRCSPCRGGAARRRHPHQPRLGAAQQPGRAAGPGAPGSRAAATPPGWPRRSRCAASSATSTTARSSGWSG